MKMNELEGLFSLLQAMGSQDLTPYHPKAYSEQLGGRSLAQVGTEPILYMRHFQRTGQLPAELLELVVAGEQ